MLAHAIGPYRSSFIYSELLLGTLGLPVKLLDLFLKMFLAGIRNSKRFTCLGVLLCLYEVLVLELS